MGHARARCPRRATNATATHEPSSTGMFPACHHPTSADASVVGRRFSIVSLCGRRGYLGLWRLDGVHRQIRQQAGNCRNGNGLPNGAVPSRQRFSAYLRAMLQPHITLPGLVDQVLDAAEADNVDLRTILDTVGQASFAAILLLPALAVATPLSGIPFFSSLMGILICLVSVQMLARRPVLWLPRWVLDRQIKGETLRRAFGRLRPAMQWLDRHTTRRWRIFAHRPLIFIPQLLCLISGSVMPLLEFVPFTSSVLGVGVAVLALGMLTRDGVVMTIALIPYGLGIWLLAGAV